MKALLLLSLLLTTAIGAEDVPGRFQLVALPTTLSDGRTIVDQTNTFKLDTVSGRTWIFNHYSDGVPMWIEVRNADDIRSEARQTLSTLNSFIAWAEKHEGGYTATNATDTSYTADQIGKRKREAERKRDELRKRFNVAD